MNKEDRQAEKLRRQQNRMANKMLIPAPKKTVQSLKLLNFDPSGTFHFAEDRWIRIYEVYGKLDRLMARMTEMKSEIMVSGRILPEKEDMDWFLTLTGYGETYDEVRKQFALDEAVLNENVGIRPLSVDEAVKIIFSRLQGDGKEFSYASFVRSKKNLYDELFPKIIESYDSFQIEASYGTSLFIMNYPKTVKWNVFTDLQKLGCPIFFTFQMSNMKEEDRESYIRMLERRYCRNFPPEDTVNGISISCHMSFVCDSADAREIIQSTILSLLSKEGYIVAPLYGKQRMGLLSDISLGMLESREFRNISLPAVEKIFWEENANDNDKV